VDLRRLAPIAAALFVMGCPKSEPARQDSPPPKKPDLAKGPLPDDYWLEGKLPPAAQDGAPQPGGTLTVRIHAEPPHLSAHVLDPLDLLATRITLGRVYETLYRIDAKDHPRYRMLPSAAESYEESADHLVYTFKLRKGMKFHDGKPVTAHDVAATLEKILDPKEPTSSARSSYTDVKEFKALDDQTFRVVLAKPHFFFLRQIATTMPIMPRHLIGKGEFRSNPIHRAPVGSGPWKFVSWSTMQEVVLARNDDYWGKKPLLDKVAFRIVPDHTIATQLFERGEFDLMTQIQHSVWVDMVNNPEFITGYNRIRFFPKNYEWVGWNEERPFFSDARVRKAMALLFDRDSFNRTILYNLEKPTACHFYHESEDCDPTLSPLPYDPAQAKALLREAGWEDHDGDGVLDKGGTPFHFTFLMPANSVFLSKLTVVLKESYRKVGIEMEISKLEWAVFSKRIHDHEFDACSMLWGDTDSWSDPYQIWHSSQAKDGSNFIGFKSAKADELIEQARVEFDPAKRSALYRELGRILYQEQPYLWLNIRPDLDSAKKRVKGLYPSLNFYNFDDVWLERPPAQAVKP
jgi:peptide/nickel transport system substrate-binding protein